MTSSTNYTGIHYIEESVAGSTPASPAFQTLPTTQGAPQGNITTTESAVIRRDRQIDDLIVTDADISASIGYELSYDPYKPFLIALLQNGAPVNVNISAASDISITNTAGVITLGSTSTDFVVAGLVVGMHIRITGFATAGNNGIYRVTEVADDTVTLEVYGKTIVTEAAGAAVTIRASMLRNGAQTPKSYSFLRTIEGIQVPAFMYYRGMQVSSMSFNFATAQILTGTMEMVGLSEDATTTPLAGQSIVDVGEYALMNSVSSVARATVAGLPANTKFQTINLTVNNNINAAKAIGTLGAADLASFTLNVTADVRIYFDTIATYQMYRDSEDFMTSFQLEDALGNIMVVTMHKCKFNTMEIPPEGKDNFLMLNGSFRALRDPVTNSTIQFDFFDAA